MFKPKIVPKPNTPWWIRLIFTIGLFFFMFGYYLSLPHQYPTLGSRLIFLGILMFSLAGIIGFEITI